MPEVGIATVSGIAAAAGARMADEGGNAVDAAVAASLVAVITHPGMCSLGGGGYLTIWHPDGTPVTVDGGMEMPGRGQPHERFGAGGIPIHLEYAGGVDTVVGPGAVATPGGVAACGLALELFGRLPWSVVLEPAIERAEGGFPLPAASAEYLGYAHERIFGWHDESAAALHDADGNLRPAGAELRIEGLAETLRTLASEGPDSFYRGEIARRTALAVQEGGGLLGERDLAAYRARVRPALRLGLDDWSLATNPPPAIGGVALAAMLELMGDRPRGAWTAADIARLVRTQETVLGYRRRHLDASETREVAGEWLLSRIRGGELDPELAPRATGLSSASTLHTSTVDGGGLVCSATFSDGYGSGLMPPGSGFWLNNCLGEAELNARGFHGWRPGTRLPSNMAPTAGRSTGGAAIAIGSPGADRITTAILQTLLAYVRLGRSLEEAVLHPRLHVEGVGEEVRVVCEPGLPVDTLDRPVRRYDRPSMFFGGVEAAVLGSDGELELAADPRRTGGTAIGFGA